MKTRNNYSGFVKKFASGLAVVSIAFSGNAFASYSSQKQEMHTTKIQATNKHKANPIAHSTNGKAWELGKGWKISSFGGLTYEHPNDARYWFKASGTLRLDETFFMGSYRDKQNNFPSGAYVRTADIYFDGGLGQDWEYTMALEFRGSFVSFGDVWLAYSGFCDNNQVFVGRVPGNWFGLDNANSSSWNPFLERSIQTLAFYPGDGLGVMTDFWWENGAITLSAFQPNQTGDHTNSNFYRTFANRNLPEVRDRWTTVARGTFAPVHDEGYVWHFGISAAWRETVSAVNGVPVNTVRFATLPSARARHTSALLDTGPIRANNTRWLNVEMAHECGPVLLEGEYTEVFVHRLNDDLGMLRFHGWNVQGRYLLTGESHEYDVRDGQFGSVKPRADFGAIEMAVRYDYLNLNDKTIRGGTEHNVTLGLNWFVNGNVRLSANYIRAGIHPLNDALKRNLDIVGMRVQVRFK